MITLRTAKYLSILPFFNLQIDSVGGYSISIARKAILFLDIWRWSWFWKVKGVTGLQIK